MYSVSKKYAYLVTTICIKYNVLHADLLQDLFITLDTCPFLSFKTSPKALRS